MPSRLHRQILRYVLEPSTRASNYRSTLRGGKSVTGHRVSRVFVLVKYHDDHRIQDQFHVAKTVIVQPFSAVPKPRNPIITSLVR